MNILWQAMNPQQVFRPDRQASADRQPQAAPGALDELLSIYSYRSVEAIERGFTRLLGHRRKSPSRPSLKAGPTG